MDAARPRMLAAPGVTPNSSKPSMIRSMSGMPISAIGYLKTSIRTTPTPMRSTPKSPCSPKNGYESPPRNQPDALDPRPMPDAYLWHDIGFGGDRESRTRTGPWATGRHAAEQRAAQLRHELGT